MPMPRRCEEMTVHSMKQVKTRLHPDTCDAFREALRRNGDTAQEVLEEFILRYIEDSV